MFSRDVSPPASLLHAPYHPVVSRRVVLGRAGAALAAGVGLLSPQQIAAAPSAAPPTFPAPAFADSVGPVDGELRFDTAMFSTRTRRFFLDVSDCIISATFRNPFAAARDGDFSYGFRFRMVGDRGTIIYVNSGGNWVRVTYDDDGRPIEDTRQFGPVLGLRLGEDETNDLRVSLTGDVGELWVNNVSIAAFRVDDLTSGNVEVIGAGQLAMGVTLPEAVTRYERFIVGPPSLPSSTAQAARAYLYGPASGGIPHNPDNNVVKYRGTGVRALDGRVSARFFVPYDDPVIGWDCGFVLRATETQELRVILLATRQYAIVVGSRPDRNAQWTFRQTTGGVLPNVRTADGAFNDMETTFSGATGRLSVNATPVNASFDVSSVPEPGFVYVATGLRRNERRDAVTRYENLTIAPLP